MYGANIRPRYPFLQLLEGGKLHTKKTRAKNAIKQKSSRNPKSTAATQECGSWKRFSSHKPNVLLKCTTTHRFIIMKSLIIKNIFLHR